MFDPSYDHYAKNFCNWTVWAELAKCESWWKKEHVPNSNTYLLLGLLGGISHFAHKHYIRTWDSICVKPSGHFGVWTVHINIHMYVYRLKCLSCTFSHAKEWEKKTLSENADRNWNIFVKWQLSRYAFFFNYRCHTFKLYSPQLVKTWTWQCLQNLFLSHISGNGTKNEKEFKKSYKFVMLSSS